MPYYDYKCNNNHTTEKRMPISGNTDGIKCPECDLTAKKVVSMDSSFVLKGKGWSSQPHNRYG